MNALKAFTFLLFSCTVVLWHCATASGQNSILNQIINSQEAIVGIDATTTQLYKSPHRSAVRDKRTGRILLRNNVKAASYERSGSGVIIHASGIIVTNAHNVNMANKITVTLHDGTSLNAGVLRVVKDLDIALLKVDLPHPVKPIEMANSNNVQLGDNIITVGNSSFLKQTVSGGRVIGLGRSRSAGTQRGHMTDLIQTTVNLYSGDSGGPLFDNQGRLIGLMTAKETAADHSSFAIPSNKIMKYMLEYLSKP